MSKVTIGEIALGAMFVFMGWTGVRNGELYYWKVPVLYPKEFGWTLIAFGVCIPVAAFILRSSLNHEE